MHSTRRRMITATMRAAGFGVLQLSAGALSGQARTSPTPQPQPMTSPNAPQNENAPLGLETDIPVHGEGHPVVPAIWMDIKTDAQKLLDLATDFKWQVQHANLAATLPLLLLQEAHSIEKLAKQVQERMKR